MNVLHDNILEPLRDLVATAFASRLKLYLQDTFEMQAPRGLVIRPLACSWVHLDHSQATVSKRYTVPMRYYERLTGAVTLAQAKQLSEAVSEIEEMVWGSADLIQGGAYRWHNAQITAGTYEPELTAEEQAVDGLRVVEFTLTFDVTDTL